MYQGSCTFWWLLEDYSKRLQQPFWNIYYRMSLHVLLVQLRMLQSQTVETLSADRERQVPLSTVLRPVYNRKPMQGVQDWCYMFSFCECEWLTRQKNSVLSVAVSTACLEDHTGERCSNLADMLSGRVPVFCKHPLWCTAWYDQYNEFGNNRLWLLHLLASPWSEMYQNILLSSSLTMLQKQYYYLLEAVITHLSQPDVLG